MAEALLLGVVRGVANKAAHALVQTVTSLCGVEADRRKLERQLLAVQCKLADAEAKSKTNQYVKRWMKALAELLRNKTRLWPAHNFVQKLYKKA
jgi:hypothetical protein